MQYVEYDVGTAHFTLSIEYYALLNVQSAPSTFDILYEQHIFFTYCYKLRNNYK